MREVLKQIVCDILRLLQMNESIWMDYSGKFLLCVQQEMIFDCLIAGYFLKFMPYVKFNKIVFSERNDYHLPKIMASKHFWLTIQ